MRRIAVVLMLLGSIGLVSAVEAGDVDGRAVLGGAMGGGLGAAAGSYLGGRGGAIVGSAAGAAVGTAIATEEQDDERDVVYVAPSGGKWKKKKYKRCPPGLQMQGRC